MPNAYVKAKAGLRVRAGKGIHESTVAVMSYGTLVETTGSTHVVDGMAWIQITFPFNGWVASKWLRSNEYSRNPLDVLHLAAPFAVPFVVTSHFDDPRNYSFAPTKRQRHEGLDLDVMAPDLDSKESVLCVLPGMCVRALKSSGAYGHFVIVRSVVENTELFVWYCHMDATFVMEGQLVDLHQAIGELGGFGYNRKGYFAEHLHLNLQIPGIGLHNYVVPDVLDPQPYISMVPVQL